MYKIIIIFITARYTCNRPGSQVVDLRDDNVPLQNTLALTCLINGNYSDTVTAFGCSGKTQIQFNHSFSHSSYN